MSIPINELTQNDYLILKYINRFPSIHKTKIEQHFNGKIDALEYRLSVLADIDCKMSGGVPFPISNSNYIEEEFEEVEADYGTEYESKNIFRITDLGKAALQDHIAKTKSHKKELWIKNAWIPIIVAFVTTVLTNYIIPKLPLIIKWFANILSNFFS